MYIRNKYRISRSNQFSGVECGCCIYKATNYCWRQCSLNRWKTNSY